MGKQFKRAYIRIKKHGQEKRLNVLEGKSYADALLNPSLVDDTKVLGIPWNTRSFNTYCMIFDLNTEQRDSFYNVQHQYLTL